MKKQILSLLLVLALLLTALPGFAPPVRAEDEPVYSGSCGNNLTWSFDPNTRVLTIAGSGAMRDYSLFYSYSYPYTSTTSAPWRSFCNQITALSLPEGLSGIGQYAFYGCTALRSVTLPESLDLVEYSAFAGCSNLTKVEVLAPGCNFFNKTGTLGVSGTTTVYGYTSSSAQFYAEKYGYSFISLGDSALYGFCGSAGENLRWQFYPDSGLLEITGSGAMREYTDGQLYSNCEGRFLPPWKDYEITELSLPEGLTRIGDFAFLGQDGLSEIKLPASLKSIGESAFQGCAGLRSVKLPENLSSVGHDAFKECTQMKQVFVQNPACRVESMYLHDETGEDLALWAEYDETLGTPEETVIYGAHDEPKEKYVRIYMRQVPNRSGNHMYYGFYAEEFAKRFAYRYFPTNAFSDVKAGSYYEIPVAWAVGMGITSGTGGGKFSPKKTCTREQVVAFLWKAAGSPQPTGTVSPFPDVKPGKYYFKPVLWALEQGITSGQSDGSFGVGKPCTREQVMAFLWKSVGSPQPEGTESPFTDVAPGYYYYKPVLWALENGVTGGVSSTSFGVGQSCTRAQIVTFLYKTYGD